MTGTTTLTLGGLLLALIILYANLRPWWTGGREIKKLAAFLKGFGVAACAAACPGGILGWAHAHTGSLANGAGEQVGEGATGATHAASLTSGQLAGLGATGAFIVALAVFAVALTWKEAPKADKRRITGGAFVGSVLCLTAGVAGLLSWLPGTLNAAGDGIVAAFQGAGVL
ncbi:hypothetical protein [Streptomyces sp. NBC_00566]|uniref:hypothetical protein n=1 Tax=Streptomyces sp. NBC_00566 TaxID=2975778 RepID=UPI002E80B204|nr:hypothetical protein [Streptomyces sp. NBC_00566]WUB88245.1 hypothetical protein OG812_17350 [Streptomyces sp. NBC_00566]